MLLYLLGKVSNGLGRSRGGAEKWSYSGYILKVESTRLVDGGDTFSPVDWFTREEYKIKSGRSSLSAVYGKCRCSGAYCPMLTQWRSCSRVD